MHIRRPPPSKIGRGNYYQYTCDRCGYKYSSESQREEWTGLFVCTWCLDEKHPQLEPYLYINTNIAQPDHPRPSRPFEAATCALYGLSAIVGQCQVGCAVVGVPTRFKAI